MSPIAVFLLRLELDLWSRLGVAPAIWWRDDDARQPTPALDRLLDLAGGLPLSVAIIPDGDLTALATRLVNAPNVTMSQHGVDHVNRRPVGEPPSEYPRSWRLEEMAERIGQARQAMVRAGLEPQFYTPPWNRVEAVPTEALARAGLTGLSAADGSAPSPGVRRVDCDLDILRWKGGPRFKGSGRIVRRLARLLRQRRKAGDFGRPIGLLTHHHAHDEPAWAFLDWFIAFGRERFVWRDFEAFAALQRQAT